MKASPQRKDRAYPGVHPHVPNEVVLTGMTYVASKEGWLYLAAAMDLYSKNIKGYEVQETMLTELISEALAKAMKLHPNLTGSVHHSDRAANTPV